MHKGDCISGLFSAPREQTDYSARLMPARRSSRDGLRPAGHRLPACAGQVPGARPLSCLDLYLYYGTRRKIACNGPHSAPLQRPRLPPVAKIGHAPYRNIYSLLRIETPKSENGACFVGPCGVGVER